MARRLISGLVIAAYALRWRGYGYTYGGNASRPDDWDCSSFVSYVLHACGLPIPGAGWGTPGAPPNEHGPVVIDYASWQGAVTVQDPARGDLVCFVGVGPNGHIGIVLGPNQMISALNEQVGVQVTGIIGNGPAGAPIVYRRVTGSVTKAPAGVRAKSVSQPGAAHELARAVLGVVMVGALGAAAVALAVTVGPAVIGGVRVIRKLRG